MNVKRIVNSCKFEKELEYFNNKFSNELPDPRRIKQDIHNRGFVLLGNTLCVYLRWMSSSSNTLDELIVANKEPLFFILLPNAILN